MKGSVEIYGITHEGEKELLVEQDNLTTIGFSEQITDLLTTPSSIKFPTTENTAMLDASNYEIQGFSMSKNKDAFRKNQHSYTTVNLLHNSDLKDTSGWELSEVSSYSNVILGGVSGASGTLLTANTSGAYFKQDIKYDDTLGNFSVSGIFSGTSFVGSVDVKFNKKNPPVELSGTSSFPYVGQSAFEVSSGGYTSRTLILWDISGNATLLDDKTSANWFGGIKDLGGGWNRIFLNASGPTDGTMTSFIVYPSVGISPSAYGSTSSVDGSAGSIYISRPQLELGRVPTNYVETSSFINPRDDTLAFSLLNATLPYARNILVPAWQEFKYYILSGAGGESLSAIYEDQEGNKGLSAYIPFTSSITPSPNPLDRVLTEGAITPVEDALDIKYTQGQLPNALGYGVSGYLQLSTYNTKWSYTSGYDSGLGRHVGYLGAYGVRAGNGQMVSLNFVSALNFAGYSTPLSSMFFSTGAADQCLDRFGYWELSGDGTANPVIPANAYSEFVKTVVSDFSSTGEITYHIKMDNVSADTGAQRDRTVLNAFGGVDTLGLWGLDLKKIREDNITANPPYSRHCHGPAPPLGTCVVEDPVRRYKLFNKLVFTDNITKMAGGTRTRTAPGVFGFYKRFDIYWKVKFL